MIAEARRPTKADPDPQEEISYEPIKTGAASGSGSGSPSAISSSRNALFSKPASESPSKSSRASSRPSSRPLSKNPSKEEINRGEEINGGEQDNGYYGSGVDGPTQTVSLCGSDLFLLLLLFSKTTSLVLS